MRFRSSCLLALFLLAAIPARSEIRQVAHWADGVTRALVREGDTVFLGQGAYFEAVDVSDPAAPVLRDRCDLEGWIDMIRVEGGIACAHTENRGVHIIDVSDPDHPAPASFYAYGDVIQDIQLSGGLLYFTHLDVDASGGLHIVDLSDPAAPVHAGFLELGGLADIGVCDGYAYVTTQYGSIEVVDARDPAAPQHVGTVSGIPGCYFSCILCGGGRLYGAARNPFGFHSLQVYGLDDPAAPDALGWTDAGEVLSTCALDGQQLYSAGTDSIVVYDVTDPTGIKVVGSAPTYDRSLGIDVGGGMVFASQDLYGMRCYTATVGDQGVALQEVGDYTAGAHTIYTDVALDGDYLYATSAAPTLTVFDARQIDAPAVVGTLNEHRPGNPDVRGYSVTVHDSIAYVRSSDESGDWLRMIEVSDPKRPQEIAKLPGGLRGIQFNGSIGYVLLAAGSYSIEAYDFQDPSLPVHVASLPLTGPGVHCVDDNVLLVALDDTLRFYDIEDPSAITERGFADLDWFGLTHPIMRITAANRTATIVTQNGGGLDEGLRVVSYSSFTVPIVHRGTGPDSEVWDLAADGGFLYAAVDRSGIAAYSLEHPTDPVPAGGFVTGNLAWNVACRDGLLFVADCMDGIYVLRNDQVTAVGGTPPTAPGGLRVHPNPFNPRVTIAFTLPQDVDGTLAVFDVRGRRVRTLSRGTFAAGGHEFAWDGRGDDGEALPSGTYVAALSARGSRRAVKMMLLR